MKKLLPYILSGIVLSMYVYPVQAGLVNPLAGGTSQPVSVPILVGRLVTAITGLIGVLALIYLIIGGFYYLTALGNDDRIKKGQTIIVWAVVGLVLSFTSYAIVSFLVTSFEGFGG